MPVLHIRMDCFALDRPGTHERDLHGQVLEVLGPRLQQALHLRAALDLEDADRVRLLDLLVDAGVVERHTREVDRLASQPRDAVDRVLDGREHAEPEEIDLQEAGVAAAVLVPLADLASCHRGGLYRHEVDQRPGRDDHAAGMLADVTRQPCDLLRQLAERGPAWACMCAGHAVELVSDAGRIPAVGDPCEPFQLGERQPERLADVANRTTAAIARERRDERGVLTAVALGDAHDQLLSDVTRKVEVDVGHGDHLVVDEATERQAGRDGIDVREACQVADDRPNTGAAARAPAAAHDVDCRARVPRARTRGRARALPSGAGRTLRARAARSARARRRAVAARVSCGRSHSHIGRRMLGRRSLRAAGLRDPTPSEKSG